MGEMHVTYKQVGFMQMKPVGGKSWRKSGWVWQPGMKAEIQCLLQCLQFLPVGKKKKKPFYCIFTGLQRLSLGNHGL